MQSSNNHTDVPLTAGSIFLGKYDKVLNFANAYYSIVSDQDCQVVVYQSNDRTNYSTTVYSYDHTNGYVTQTTALTQAYVYLTVRNTTGTNQDVLHVSMIYK
jgi:hypothetical protein